MTQGAETAQHRRDQRPRQRTVAFGKGGKSGIGGDAIELFVERSVSAQHAIDDIGGDAPGRQARNRVVVAVRTSLRFGWRRHRAFLARIGRRRRAAVNGRSGRCDPPCSRAAGAPSEGHVDRPKSPHARGRCCERTRWRKAAADPVGATGVGRGGGAPRRARSPSGRSSEGNPGPRRSRTNPLRRLGNQRRDVGFLAAGSISAGETKWPPPVPWLFSRPAR